MLLRFRVAQLACPTCLFLDTGFRGGCFCLGFRVEGLDVFLEDTWHDGLQLLGPCTASSDVADAANVPISRPKPEPSTPNSLNPELLKP